MDRTINASFGTSQGSSTWAAGGQASLERAKNKEKA